ncbi:AAA family ATPase [Methanotorris formicicus]|uniref:ATPase associated with various cellular activities AAA_5 n=1 Tax=Methanotorris formicicus Mc-S-70 TaxID=647171 RepID=H1L0I3_9EURY|nr:AAA family ATPase [Methanotorris formicicus]EHP84815.1 ATPase associated with various cellular activities AAA_5 [Methanotorris formicicus Mc-S-70]
MKLQKIREELRSYFIERDEEVDIALTALIANEHCIFLGNPGVAKSQLIRAIASHINANYFEKLITRFSTEDELFGPLSIKELKENDRFVRKTENYLPNAEIAFLDEIFKANSSILNALLSIMNERIYHNGDVIQRVPLISLFGASNELPEENELLAFYDRFLFRKIVSSIKSKENLKNLIYLDEEYIPSTKITTDDIKKLQKKAEKVNIDNIIDYLIDIKTKLNHNNVFISDRRLKKSIKAIKSYALLNGKKEADEEDLEILRHVFWDEVEDYMVVSKIVFEVSNSYSQYALEKKEVLNHLKKELKYIDTKRIKNCGKDYNKLIEILCKVGCIKLELKKMKNEAKSNNKKTGVIDRILKETEEFDKIIEGLLNEL